MADFWSDWVAGMTPERSDLVRWFIVRMRTTAGIHETVTAMLAAIHVLDHDGGRELADRLAAKKGAMSE